MNPTLLTPLAFTATGYLAALALKATVVLVVAAVASQLLTRRSAAHRHGVWTLAVAALLALPVLQALAPPLAAPLPFAGGVTKSKPLSTLEQAPGGPAQVEERSTDGAAPTTAQLAGPSRAAQSPVAPAPLPWQALAAIAWALGALVTLGFFATGRFAVSRLARRARPVEDPAWRALAAEVAARLGVRRPLRLLIAEDAATPLTWGTRRPTILLPASAALWSEPQRRAFLVHELAHVGRRDCAIQEAAHIACALYWFHPGAWFAAHRLRVERERACDDAVLVDGASAPAYAGQLLAVVRAARTPRGALSLSGAAMAAPSQLESRVRALLDGAIDRSGIGRRRAMATTALALAAVLPLAALVPKATPTRAATAKAPGGGTIAERWQEALEASDGKAYWIAYAIDYASAHPDVETLCSDSEGWNSKDLTRRGTSLATRFAYQKDDAVLLFRIPARGPGKPLAFDRIALRSAYLAPEMGGLRIVSMGRVNTEESLDWIRKQLDDAPADQRAPVLVTAIALHESPNTIGMLVELLEGKREEAVRAQAAEGMERHPGAPALDVLVAHARGDASETVRRESAETIGDLDYAPATDALIDLVRDVEPANVRAEAVEALGSREPDRVVSVLVAVANDDEEENVRREAVETLGDLPDNAGLEALRKMAMGHPDPGVRSEAVETLNDLGLKAERAAARGSKH